MFSQRMQFILEGVINRDSLTTANKSENVNRKVGLLSHFIPSASGVSGQDRHGGGFCSIPSAIRVLVEVNR